MLFWGIYKRILLRRGGFFLLAWMLIGKNRLFIVYVFARNFRAFFYLVMIHDLISETKVRDSLFVISSQYAYCG